MIRYDCGNKTFCRVFSWDIHFLIGDKMGATSVDFILPGDKSEYEVEEAVRLSHEEDLVRFGNQGYTGSWAEVPCHRVIFPFIPVLKSYEEAEEYVFDGENGRAEKWEPAVAVKFIDDDGEEKWLVGAVASE